MAHRDTLRSVLWVVLAVLVVAVLVGQVLGQPVLLSYVETESMSPSIRPGDGFIAIPAGLTGPPEPGDVVVFRATEIDGGGLTTHRVVGETEDGYLTKGDANVVSDQDSGEPPVQSDQIVAEALQIGGRVVVIPWVGIVASTAQSLIGTVRSSISVLFGGSGPIGGQSLAYLLFSGGVLVYLWSIYQERKDTDRRTRPEPKRNDDSIDARTAVFVLAVFMAAVLTGSMLFADTTHEFGVVSSEQDSARQYVIEQGTAENVTYTVPSYGVLPAAVFLEPASSNITVQPEQLYVPAGSTANATITLAAPPETGHHPQFLTERRYLGILPMGVLQRLYHVHPVMPMIIIDLLVGGGVIGFGWGLLGNRRIRLGSRRPERPLIYRIREWLR